MALDARGVTWQQDIALADSAQGLRVHLPDSEGGLRFLQRVHAFTPLSTCEVIRVTSGTVNTMVAYHAMV